MGISKFQDVTAIIAKTLMKTYKFHYRSLIYVKCYIVIVIFRMVLKEEVYCRSSNLHYASQEWVGSNAVTPTPLA
jgi:hypothetical protein